MLRTSRYGRSATVEPRLLSNHEIDLVAQVFAFRDAEELIRFATEQAQKVERSASG
jgi:hypothetical protein